MKEKKKTLESVAQTNKWFYLFWSVMEFWHWMTVSHRNNTCFGADFIVFYLDLKFLNRSLIPILFVIDYHG